MTEPLTGIINYISINYTISEIIFADNGNPTPEPYILIKTLCSLYLTECLIESSLGKATAINTV